MAILLACVLPGLVVGVIGYLATRRWPERLAAPHIDAQAVASEVRSHPRLRRLLRSRLDQAELTGLALTAALTMCVLAAAGIGALLAMIHTGSGLAHWDGAFARFGAHHAQPATTTFLRDVSLLGGYPGVTTVAVVVAVIETKRHHKITVAAFLVLACEGQFLVANLVKSLVHRQRPDVLRLTGFAGSSFPSGHATASAATLAACALLLGRGRSRPTRAALFGAAAGLASVVAASRVLLGVHWFTDVLAGLLLGWAWFAVCSIAFGGRLLRFGQPAQVGVAVAANRHQRTRLEAGAVEGNASSVASQTRA